MIILYLFIELSRKYYQHISKSSVHLFCALRSTARLLMEFPGMPVVITYLQNYNCNKVPQCKQSLSDSNIVMKRIVFQLHFIPRKATHIVFISV